MVLSVIFLYNLNLEGRLNRFIGSKVTAILVSGGFYIGVELHREGSAPAACAAGFFLLLEETRCSSFVKRYD